MARQYQPRKFFRQAPNNLLEQYFKEHELLTEVDFDELTETKIEPIYDAWLKLPEETVTKMERDFREIDFLANEGGTKAILDEANWHGADLSDHFSEMNGHHERSFWTFLNRRDYWQGALLFHHADSIAFSFWRKRKKLPHKSADVDPESIRKLEIGISKFFHSREGRGRNCKVECYRRNDLDYFFAYPEDYAQASIEWIGNEFQRRSHHPAFEVIFVFSENDGTLDTYLLGDRKPVPDLQAIFAEAVLKIELGNDKEDERIYDLNPLKSRDFQFIYNPESGIEDVVVKRMRLSLISSRGKRLILEANPTNNREALYDLLEDVSLVVPLSDTNVTQVGIKVSFSPHICPTRSKTKTFNISWPNSCSLKQDGRDLVIRKMLAASGIEPKEAEKADQP